MNPQTQQVLQSIEQCTQASIEQLTWLQSQLPQEIGRKNFNRSVNKAIRNGIRLVGNAHKAVLKFDAVQQKQQQKKQKQGQYQQPQFTNQPQPFQPQQYGQPYQTRQQMAEQNS